LLEQPQEEEEAAADQLPVVEEAVEEQAVEEQAVAEEAVVEEAEEEDHPQPQVPHRITLEMEDLKAILPPYSTETDPRVTNS
jgi:hypothetical protein